VPNHNGRLQTFAVNLCCRVAQCCLYSVEGCRMLLLIFPQRCFGYRYSHNLMDNPIRYDSIPRYGWTWQNNAWLIWPIILLMINKDFLSLLLEKLTDQRFCMIIYDLNYAPSRKNGYGIHLSLLYVRLELMSLSITAFIRPRTSNNSLVVRVIKGDNSIKLMPTSQCSSSSSSSSSQQQRLHDWWKHYCNPCYSRLAQRKIFLQRAQPSVPPGTANTRYLLQLLTWQPTDDFSSKKPKKPTMHFVGEISSIQDFAPWGIIFPLNGRLSNI